jgi:hypothetical protein
LPIAGPEPWKKLTSGMFVAMWVAFIFLSGLKEYDHIFASDSDVYCLDNETDTWLLETSLNRGNGSYCDLE